jgi:hypothetical protein
MPNDICRRGLGRLLPSLPSPVAMMQQLVPSAGAAQSQDTATSSAASPAAAAAAARSRGGAEGQERIDGSNKGQCVANRPRGPCPVCGTTETLQPVVALPCRCVCVCVCCLEQDACNRPRSPCPVCGTTETLQPVVALPCRCVCVFVCLNVSVVLDRMTGRAFNLAAGPVQLAFLCFPSSCFAAYLCVFVQKFSANTSTCTLQSPCALLMNSSVLQRHATGIYTANNPCGPSCYPSYTTGTSFATTACLPAVLLIVGTNAPEMACVLLHLSGGIQCWTMDICGAEQKKRVELPITVL